LSGYAWGVIGVTTAFIALTCWWLTQDRSIPVYDAGGHLSRAFRFHDLLQGGHLSEPFTFTSVYPPLVHLVGALAAFIGGVNVASPIIGANVIFVPLLTLGCYQTGRLLFGPLAGLLAAVFVLGSPLLIAQFHVFMLDAPETAVVAVSMWLILASEDFSRVHVAAWAGLAVGCGLLIKETSAFFIAGIVLVALARGGWRRRRGLVAFFATALVVGAPWYLYHLSKLRDIASIASGAGSPAGNVPPTLSIANLTWYFWSALNSLLYAPLVIFVVVGAIWMISAVPHDRITKGPGMEFLVGGLVAWLANTLAHNHDLRYNMPLLPYLAVIGTGWIVYVSRRVRVAAIGVLALAVAANTLGTTFGVGKEVSTALVSSPAHTAARPDRIVWYSNAGYLVAGPQRDGDVLGLLRALRRRGVRQVTFRFIKEREDVFGPGPSHFSTSGLLALSLIAHLDTSPHTELVRTGPQVVALIHRRITSSAPPPCTRLSNGTGVYVLRLNPAVHRLSLYCPYSHPDYYPGATDVSGG
jgi:4-amino-4-deoxy-L-arabinose transferase-like glycosyltransferase